MAHKHWENPEVVGFGRLPARASFGPPAENDLRLDLNGMWQFKRVAHPSAAVADWQVDVGVGEGWSSIEVPSLWTLRPDLASEDRPIYTNVKMPFHGEPPSVPEENPTGLCRREVHVPDDWCDDRIVMHIGGVENCYYLYCNGVEVGFAKDCRLPSEFDLSEYLHPGRNIIALQVMRWSDSSYIEDQDQWWHAGIHRAVYLQRTGLVYLRDIFAKPVLDVDTGCGHIDVDVRIGPGDRSALEYTVYASLEDSAGVEVDLGREQIQKAQFAPLTGKGVRVVLHKDVGNVDLWSAEAPQLYTLQVSLADQQGMVVETTRIRVGFRHVEIRDRQLLVNGQAVLIKGVNRHDHSELTGKVISEELMRLDIETMKQHNINAVRTSHYPNDSRFYELCDEYGLYVFDECNIEAHHHYQQLGEDPAWATAFMNRVVRMVERDKNHPSIIAWSMGNETGFGPHHAAMAAWVREYDPSRVIHNESAICEQAVRSMWEDNRHGTDLVCPMYPSVEDIVNHATHSSDPRPLIMCEFAHAMGNSCGNLKEYWQAVERYHGLQGGFIWEWLDHGLLQQANGIAYWAYGGDFGESRHDLNFVCDGLCWPDRTPHSSLLEYKSLLQPVDVKSLRGTRYRIKNKQWFTDLAWLRGCYELLLDGVVYQRGDLPSFSTAPQSSDEFSLNYERPRLKPGQELSIVFRLFVAENLVWARSGHEVAVVQCELGRRDKPKPHLKSRRSTLQEEGKVGYRDAQGVVQFDETGWCSWSVQGRELLHQGPMLNIWRAPLDNDGIKGWQGQEDKPLGRWRRLGLEDVALMASSVNQDSIADVPIVGTQQRYEMPGGAIEVDSRYWLFSSSDVEVEHRFVVGSDLTDLPRLGVRFALRSEFEDLAWFGRGPHESYGDRRTSGTVQLHKSTVSNQYVPYILPQEHGNHTDVRWMNLSDGTLEIRFDAMTPIEASASRYPHEMLTPAFHTYELTPQEQIWLSLDVMQRGLGGASCGPDTLDQYRLQAGEHSLRYRVSAQLLTTVGDCV